jgi:pentose-5-phosphate-3-epimerase
MLVTPSILVADAHEITLQIQKLLPYCNHFQIDIADGIYVPGKTASADQIVKELKTHAALLAPNCILDFHLMVQDYKKTIQTISVLAPQYTLDTFLIHANLGPSRLEIQLPEGCSIGLAFNPNDPVHNMVTNGALNNWDCAQVMSVVPGAQGQPFIKESFKLIDAIKSHNYKLPIYLDGGINKASLEDILLWENKPDIIGPGSYFSKSSDVKKTLHEMQELGKKHHVVFSFME